MHSNSTRSRYIYILCVCVCVPFRRGAQQHFPSQHWFSEGKKRTHTQEKNEEHKHIKKKIPDQCRRSRLRTRVGQQRQTTAYVSIRQPMSAYVSIRRELANKDKQQHMSAYVSICQHTSAYDEIWPTKTNNNSMYTLPSYHRFAIVPVYALVSPATLNKTKNLCCPPHTE